MSRRYFVDEPIRDAVQVALGGTEAHHLLHVMRATPGDEVTLFDGSGWEFTARVTRTTRREVDFDVLARAEVDRELPFPVTLAVALPKGDRQRWLVEKATELGVTRLVPVETERGVAQPTDKALDRLRRGVVEASKQCGRNRLMEITEPARLVETLQSSGAGVRWVAHPRHSASVPLTRALTACDRPTALVAAIGPEGGFSDNELRLAAAVSAVVVDLGPRILRVETAALVIASAVANGVLSHG